MNRLFFSATFLIAILSSTSFAENVSDSPLIVPNGFKIEIFASVPNARQMALTKSGHLVVGTRRNGVVYGLKKDAKKNTYRRIELLNNRNMPAGVAINKKGDLYIAATHEILSIKNIDQAFHSHHFPIVTVTDRLPKYDHHGWKHIGFSPDGQLVIPFGVPCNICLSDNPIIGSLQSYDLTTKTLTPLATGVRNSVGFDWHPASKELWFSDNGRDWMGDDQPSDEINRVANVGDHFGFPFIHGKDTWEPDSSIQSAKPKGLKVTAPAVEIQAHSAPLGIHFYTGQQFPARYKHALFVALHGSWNRSTPVGYKIMAYWFDDAFKLSKQEVLVDGFLIKSGPKAGEKFGRPVDFLQMPDGSLLISDDKGGKIWRLSYIEQTTAK